MDSDDTGLELSLGLGYGDSSTKSKDKAQTSSDLRGEDGDKPVKKNFFTVNSLQHDSRTTPPQKIEKENLFSNLSNADAEPNISLWDRNLTNSPTLIEEKRAEPGHKRKLSIGDSSSFKKVDRDIKTEDFPSKKSSYISLTIEDGSVAESEDVAESTPSENSKHSNLNLYSHFSVQTKVNNAASSSLDIFNVMQLMPSSNDEQKKTNPSTFGYSPLHLPTLDSHSGWVLGSHQPPKPGQTSQNGIEPKKKPDVAIQEEGSSSRVEESESNRPTEPEGGSYDLSSIKPGILADLKFGGSGSCPNLPWVSTTGSGPNGRTISGVTYKYNATQIKIVCACHGSHMTPEEFVVHATAETDNADANGDSPTVSAQS